MAVSATSMLPRVAFEYGHTDFVEREAMELDEELSARKYLDAVERAVVGFAWEW